MSNEEELKDKVEAPAEGEPAPAEEAVESAAAETAVTPDAAEAPAEQDAADEVKEEEKTEPEKSEPESKKAEKPAKPEKAKKPEKKREPKGMSKLFKLIYFPAIALFALIMLIFSIVDGAYGYKPKAYADSYYTAVNTHISTLSSDTRSSMAPSGLTNAKNYIISTLTDGGFKEVAEVKAGDEDNDDDVPVTTVTDWSKASGVSTPTVTVMTSVPSIELQDRIGVSKYTVGSVTDIVAAIPSKHTVQNDRVLDNEKVHVGAVIMTVRYDTRPDTVGAAGNAAFVANVMQSLIGYVKNNTGFEKDLVVVFTESLDCSLGSYAFFESFKGLGDVVSRAELGIDLDAFGNGGTLALTDATEAGYSYVRAYTKVAGSVFDSSVVKDAIPDNFASKGAVKAFGHVPALQVAVVGGLEAAGSLTDNAKNISGAIVYQQADLVKSYIDAFAVGGKTVKASSKNVTVMPYFDGAVVYSHIAAYVIGIITLAVIAGAVVAIVLKKTFSIKKLFIALGVELLVIASTLAVMFAAYFLLALMLTGFGVLPIHAITSVRYFNGGLMVAAMLISIASAFGFTSLYKKLFKVTSSDTVRGTAMLFGIVGAIMSFAAPSYSYLTAWAGLLLTALLLVTACLNGKLKSAFGIGFDRLFVFVIPVVICMPFMLGTVTMLSALLPLYMLPVIMTLFTAMLGVVVPYLDRTQKVFDKLAKKLPMRTQRVERTVTERVEDRAKKGKFTEVTVKRVEKEKVPVNYKNYFGISLIAVIGCVVALIAGSFGAAFGNTITPLAPYDDSIYNDSLVYVWEKDSSGNVTQNIIVDDLVAYKYMRYAVDDLTWDAVNSRYYKKVYYSDSEIIGDKDSQPNIDRNDYHYTVRTFDGGHSAVTLKISGASSVTRLTVKNDVGDAVAYDYTFNKADTITLRLPYGFGSIVYLDFEGGKPSTIHYEEHREVMPSDSSNMLYNVDEWNYVVNKYRSDGGVMDSLRGGIVLKAAFSL